MKAILFQLLTGLLILTMVGYTENVSAQCKNKLELSSVKKASKSQSNGSIEVKIESADEYSIILYSVDGAGLHPVSTQQGTGVEKYKFKSLNGQLTYLVQVSFKNETDFLCKKRVISDIFLTKER